MLCRVCGVERTSLKGHMACYLKEKQNDTETKSDKRVEDEGASEQKRVPEKLHNEVGGFDL